MPTSARSCSGTSIPRPALRSGWSIRTSWTSTPSKDLQGFEDLKRFPLFEDAWLRGGPVRRWVPKAFADKPIYVFETGGTTGIPKSRIAIDDFRTDYELFGDNLPEEHFPGGPTG